MDYEKGGHSDGEDRRASARDTLAKEVYGVGLTDIDTATGDVRPLATDKFTAWNLKIRQWIANAGAEEGGIERVPPELRTNQPPRDIFTLFMSANVGTATLAFGTLGPGLFYLGWWDSFLCLLFFNIIGSIPPALVATLGPKLGLRTMVCPRYSFGWWPAKFIAILNFLNQLGWAMVNTIAGANILYDVGQGKLPLSVAVLIIGLLAIFVGLIGYRFVHIYERWSWIVMTICFCVVAGFGAKHFVNVPWGSGPTETSSVLSFGTAIIGFQISWAPIAADYAVYMRETTKPWKVFWWAFWGLFISQFLIELLGAALMTTVSGSQDFQTAYDNAGIGGLCGQIFVGYGTGVRNFGYFIETILSLSVVAVVIVNIYSLGLNVQVISQTLLRIPRLIWSLLGGAVFLIAAVAGRSHLQTVMENFVGLPFALISVPLLNLS